jgi:hypothetical protein
VLPKTRKEALETGSKYYLSDSLCKNGHKSPKWTFKSMCMECSRRNANKYKAANPELIKEKGRIYDSSHREEINARTRKYYSAKRNSITAKRRAFKKNATPTWANKDLIECKYLEAKFMEWFIGEKYHVDHIIPLQSETVCGLHVEYNLQVIPAKENHSKSNIY